MNAHFPSSSMMKSLSLQRRGGEWFEDFCKVLYKSPVEANVPKKAPQISYNTWKREVLDDLYIGLVHL